MDFADPQWLWLLAGAPVVAAIVALAWRRRLVAAAAWAARGLWDRLLPTFRLQRLVLSTVLLVLAFIGVALALARPRWGESDQQVERQGVDIVFLLDTSLSMATRDVQPSRLWVAQSLVRRLVEELPGHRTALLQAEGDGVAMVPLTVDSAVIDLLLDAVQPGSLPTPGTDLAQAFEKAISLYPEDGDKHRVLIALSDGEDHGGAMEKAIAKLEEGGVVVHAIGIGTPEGKPLELPRSDARAPVEYKRDDKDQVVVSRLQEETLEAVSRETGGVYLRATTAGADIEPILRRVEAMETRSYGSETISTLEERFQWPMALAVVALGLHLLISPFRQAREDGTS